ncbi:pentapeptide repeat-containing protein [Actinacidiphila sp. bgisy144]|uniref:pentapeptide repeat-containing protein n=1 Tax=Actinacidiphila sp. bgisy144 TaxID=3413791 RepID=UPI003EB9CD0B
MAITVATSASGRCLAHADAAEEAAYLASLSPGADLDLRGTTLDGTLLDRILIAMNDPTSGQPIVGHAKFSEVTFAGDAWFEEVTFTTYVSFGAATFSGQAEFTGATFNGYAEFSLATFGEDADFEGATFAENSDFTTAKFARWANFTSATFSGDASFRKANFAYYADFDNATFAGSAAFGSAAFAEDAGFKLAAFSSAAWFAGAYVAGDANFASPTFAGAPELGPLVCRGTAGFRGATFGTAVTVQVAAKTVDFRGARWTQQATVWLRYADVDLSDSLAEYPVTVAARPGSLVDTNFSPAEAVLAWELPTDQVRVTSLRGVDAAQFMLTDLDLSRCRFAGTVHLDQLRLEGDCRFAGTPAGIHSSVRRPFVRYTRRSTLAEEHQWRHSLPDAVAGWQPPAHAGSVVQPRALAAVYRALRKSYEDAGNAPGAADFYYGEMEMRRADPRTAPAERGLLTAYWALSGYGLRATRALGWLLLAVTLTMLVMMLWGLPQRDTPSLSTGTLTGRRITMTTGSPDPQNPTGPTADRLTGRRFEKSLRVVVNSVIFRSSGQDLTTTGTYTEMASRLTEPVLLGFAALAVRGRIKR